MKILYIGNDLSQKSNYHSTMATLSSLLESNGFVVYRVSSKVNKILRLLDQLFHVIKYRKIVSYVIIDTFSTSAFYFALLNAMLCRLLNMKYIPILHGGNLPYRLDKNPTLSKLIFKNCYQNVAPSGYLKYEFERRGYSTLFIPNALNIDEYQFKQRNSIQPKLLWVRAFVHLYNPTMAINVLNELLKSYPNAHLCMVGPDKGDGSFQETQNVVKELELEDKVTFTGVLPKEKWHQLSGEYDIFINTTTIDNTPVSIMEAMALGLPIVSTSVGGLPYLIENNTDGILVKNNDIRDMVYQISNLINNSTFSKNLIYNARKKVEEFDGIKVVTKWSEILK